MLDLLVAYILTVIGLTAGQINTWTTSSLQCRYGACLPPFVCISAWTLPLKGYRTSGPWSISISKSGGCGSRLKALFAHI
ncbi:unnamed protein product [Cylicocyclus nassatus]|uniref:Uncharacterized protein n=1 Tax=Cylicocyclus nassatus TaxID=53992 RepID=A0AA36M3H3_CYLNA|nr:unnamed protein product [Cylicocyclus nassatus]